MRRGKLFVAASSQTPGRYGLWIDAGPHFVVDAKDSLEMIGGCIEQALKASRQNVPYPENPKDLEKPLLELAGIRSWRSFMNGAEHCYIEQDEDGLRIIPSSSDSGGFVPRPAEMVKLDADRQPERVAEVLLGIMSQPESR